MSDSAPRLGTRYRIELLRRLGLDRVAGRVLDIGGFDGAWSAGLAGVDACVVDLDVQARHAGVEYVCADALRMPFSDGAFDVVFAIEVIEHVPDERALIREAFRVLRPGGRLVLTTPNQSIRVFPPFAQRWVNRRWQHHRVPGFAPEYLENLLAPLACEVRVRPLACRALRFSYLPMVALWRVRPSLASTLVSAAAAWDGARPTGDRGYVLAEGVAR